MIITAIRPLKHEACAIKKSTIRWVQLKNVNKSSTSYTRHTAQTEMWKIPFRLCRVLKAIFFVRPISFASRQQEKIWTVRFPFSHFGDKCRVGRGSLVWLPKWWSLRRVNAPKTHTARRCFNSSEFRQVDWPVAIDFIHPQIYNRPSNQYDCRLPLASTLEIRNLKKGTHSVMASAEYEFKCAGVWV